MATDIMARGMAEGVVSQVSADRQAVSEDRVAVEAAKTEVLNVAESIPEDYSTLSADVSELKEDLSQFKDGIDVRKPNAEWEQGRVGVNGIYLNYTDSDRNCRSKILGTSANTKFDFVVPTTLKILVLKANENKGAFSDITWGNGDLSITTTEEYPSIIVCVMKANNGLLTPSECDLVEIISSSVNTIYVQQNDFSVLKKRVDELTKKDTPISIYEADNKKSEGYIVNAIAYQYGTIIACRSNGKVVRIENTGSEVELLSLEGTNFEWRGLYMDSNENVYASPHASNGSMNVEDRGLYKLEKNANTMTKVLALYDTSSSFAPATEDNDDTIWTMCEDGNGVLYAGVYAHTKHNNPTVYRSQDGGNTWSVLVKFSTGKHIHSIVYSEWQDSLYCIVGEVNTIWKMPIGGSWTNLNVNLTTKGSALLPTENGLLIGSDDAYNCDIDLLENDDITHHKVFRGWANTIFAIRQSDKTGYIYAFTKIDSSVSSQNYYPPLSAFVKSNKVDLWSAIKTWKNSVSDTVWKNWKNYHDSICDTYPDDSIIPTHYGILVSKDGGFTWEILKRFDVAQFPKAFGFWTTGYFRNGQCLTGVYNDNGYDKPLVISECKHNYTEGGIDITGEIFSKTNTSNIATVLN